MSHIQKNFIDLQEIFYHLEEEKKVYAIIKLPYNFPAYDVGSDLDIFCYDIYEISSLIVAQLQKKIDSSLTIKVTDNKQQLYIDILDKHTIHFRFDLYGALPSYKNVNIKEAFFSSVLENARIVQRGEVYVHVPSLIDEAILRYIEYHEWYVQRPDKIKHIHYLEQKIEENALDTDLLFDKLHYYIALPSVAQREEKSHNIVIKYALYFKEMVQKVLLHVRKNGLEETLHKIKGRVFK